MRQSRSIFLVLACGLLGGGTLFPTASFSAETNQHTTSLPTFTNATSAEVDAFVAKWKPIFKRESSEHMGLVPIVEVVSAMQRAETNAPRLLTHLLGALEREPQGIWVRCLKVVAHPAKGDTPLAPGQLLGAWNQACGLLEKAAKAAPKDKGVREALELARQSHIAACLQAGRNLNDAQTMARGMLAETPTNNPNYGDVVYHAHTALGRIALRQGDRETARQELRAAGRTPGSFSLRFFGPRFVLVRELLEHGEPVDREAVVAFLDDFARFWANTDTPSARPNQLTLERQQQIETWKAEVRAGRMPVDKTPTDIFYWP